MPDGPARRELLRQRSAGDPALRARVEALLSAETPPIGPRAGGDAAPRAAGDDGALLAPAARIGRYAILNRIGEGGMGFVYAAYDERLDRRVAVKLLRQQPDTDARARLLREAQALAQISHPNVVAVHDAGETDDGHVFIAMELVEGQNLRSWAREHSWREIVEAYADAGRALARMHERGLVHRDFKPENVLIGADGRARVADFGLAARADRSQWDEEDEEATSDAVAVAVAVAASGDGEPHRLLQHTITRTGTLMGTPGYIAPEVRRGASATPASDQFSFCVSLFEALYGRRPEESAPGGGATPSTISGPATAAPVVDTTGVAKAVDGPPLELLELLRRGLEPDAAARHPSMESAIESLDRLSGGGPEADTQAERRARVVILGLILLLSMAIATMIIWRGHGRTIATARDAFIFALAPSSIILVGLFATRRALGRSQLNRQFRAIVAFTVIAFLGHRALAIRWSMPVASLLAGDAYLLGAIVAVAAVSLERWMALMAATLFAGAVGGSLWPEHAEAFFGVATFVGTAFAALHWKPSRRPFFYRARVRLQRRLRSMRRQQT